MLDDDMIDEWLREAMAGEKPRLSPRSDDSVIAQVRPRRLNMASRLVIALYTTGALALSAWALRESAVALVSASMLAASLIAFGVSAYVRRLVVAE